jgi:L-lactate dehydrogenase (cytochrome)
VVYSESVERSDTVPSGRYVADSRALLLTVDTNVLGYRQSTEKVKGTRGDASPGIRMGANTTYPAYHDAKLNWDDLDWLKDLAGGVPIYLKGVCHIDVRLPTLFGSLTT